MGPREGSREGPRESKRFQNSKIFKNFSVIIITEIAKGRKKNRVKGRG